MRKGFVRLGRLFLSAFLLVALLAPMVLGPAARSALAADPRHFPETGYRISDDAFWDYFQKRGGIATFGYPVSRKFQFMGTEVQFFQRRIVQKLPGGGVGQMNLLDEGLMPYTVANGITFPGVNADLIRTAPAVGSPDYASAALSWVRANAPETFGGAPTRFYSTFINTVTFRVAYPDGRGDPGWMPGINLEMWGLPTSAPQVDPNNHDFIYLRFQRGVMHYDRATGLTQGLLLADHLKQILTGSGLPGDLEEQAKNSPLYRQYDNSLANGVRRPDQLPNTNMKDAFEKEGPQVAPAQPAPAPAPSPTAGFRYGLQPHMVWGAERARVINATRDLGFGWLKQQIEWKIYERNQGAVSWGEMDDIVRDANANGITMLFSVVGAPDWAREPGFDASVTGPPQNPQTLANFLGAMAGRYCGKGLGAIEVWNEQNLHYEWGNQTISPAAYMNLLRPSYGAIKAACPSMVVVAGALTPTGAPAPWAMDDMVYLDGMYQHGLKNYSDAIGIHPSGFNVPPSLNHTQACAFLQQKGAQFMGPCDVPHHSWSFRSTVEGYRSIMVRHGDSNKQLWATEFGWAAGGAFDPNYLYANDNSLEEQAAWTVEAFNFMRNSGYVGAAFLWNLNFRVVADGTEKAQWGIVNNNWQPLPAYNAMKAMPK